MSFYQNLNHPHRQDQQSNGKPVKKQSEYARLVELEIAKMKKEKEEEQRRLKRNQQQAAESVTVRENGRHRSEQLNNRAGPSEHPVVRGHWTYHREQGDLAKRRKVQNDLPKRQHEIVTIEDSDEEERDEEEEENQVQQNERPTIVDNKNNGEGSLKLRVTFVEVLIGCELTSSTGSRKKATFIRTEFGCRVDVTDEDEYFVKERDPMGMAVAYLKQLIEKNARNNFEKVEFQLVPVQAPDRTFIRKRTIFLSELSRAWGGLEHKISAKQVEIRFDNDTEDDLHFILENFVPGVLETISVSTKHVVEEKRALTLDKIVHLEQWKKAKFVYANVGEHFVVHFPFADCRFKKIFIKIETFFETLLEDLMTTLSRNKFIEEVSICFKYSEPQKFESERPRDNNLVVRLTEDRFHAWRVHQI